MMTWQRKNLCPILDQTARHSSRHYHAKLNKTELQKNDYQLMIAMAPQKAEPDT
jgi:hypothetical protein